MIEIKPLNAEDYELEIVADLGRLFPTQTSTQKRRFAEFKCGCGNIFKAQTNDVKTRKTSGCKECNIRNKSTTLKNIETGTKICQTCKTIKKLTDFSNRTSSKDGKGPRCKECDNKARKKYYENNQKGRIKAYLGNRERFLKEKYNITTSEYDTLLINQSFKCKICDISLTEYQRQDSAKTGKDKRPRMFAVDHDHNTGDVRGLLCCNCNRALGMFKDSVDILTKALSYLITNKNQT